MSRLFGWLGTSTPAPAEQARWRVVLPAGVGGFCLALLFLVGGLAPSGFAPTGPFQVGEYWGWARRWPPAASPSRPSPGSATTGSGTWPWPTTRCCCART